MSIDSTQLANMLNSLELTFERDSLSQIQYQLLIDTLDKGVIVQTDWWMFGVALASVVSFIVLTVMMWRTNKKQSEQQIKVQKDNIKFQLFDKRYAVFQSVVDARHLLNRDDHFLIGAYDNNHFLEVGRLLVEMQNKLRDALFVSQCLFDKNIFERMNVILSLFMATRREFYNLNITGATLTQQITEKQKLEFQQVVTIYANDIDQMAIELEKIMPNIRSVLKKWQDAVLAFNDYIDTSGITKDFDEYLMVQNLER